MQSQFSREFSRIQRQDINEWIQVDLVDQQFDVQRDERLEGTGDWIFSHPAYQSWLSGVGDLKLLWLCGPAGSGKTVLSATVIQRLKDSSPQGPPVVYCFCSVYAQAATQLQGIIRTLISQFARQSVHMRQQIWDYMHSSTCDGGDVASQSDLWIILKELLEGTLGCTLIIDGLDEFDGSDRARSKFLRQIKSTVQNTSTKVMVASRDEGDIRDELFDAHICNISKDLVRADIRRLAEALVFERLPRKTEDLKHELSERLTDKSDGMFLWIKQQNLLLLRGSKTDSQLRRVVEKMPSGLTDTYMRNWREITNQAEDDYTRTLNMLRWTVFSFRPLTVAEITEALMVHPESSGISQEEWPDEVNEEYIQEEIKGLCGSLVNIQASPKEDPSLSTVHLAHASVKEFLITMLDSTLQDHHSELAETCLRYMNFSQVWQHDESRIQYAFLDYAVHMWQRHYEVAMKQDGSKMLEFVNSLLDPDSPTFSSLRNYWLDTNTEVLADVRENRKREPGNPLWLAAEWNLVEAAKHLLSTHPELLDTIEPGCETPLIRACVRGNTALANLLIDNDADVEFEIEGRGPALIQATRGGHMDLVVSLVGRGLNMELTNSLGRTAFITACVWNHTKIAAFLLEKGANKTVICNENTTPLFWACRNGDLALLLKLLDTSMDLITLRTKSDMTPLYASVYYNHLETAEFLLQNGADASIEATYFGKTPLLVAAHLGHLEMLHLLLSYGADLHALSDTEESALHCASWKGSSEMVEVILSLGVDPNLREAETYYTALHIAAHYGHFEVADVLLEWSANLQENGVTPLHLASYNGHTAIAALLLDHGADIDYAGSDGDTPLHWAASNGQLEVIQLLFTRGADSKVTNAQHATPLHKAASYGHLESAEKLLEIGADINAPGYRGCPPLTSAATTGQSAMVKFLLDQGANTMAGQDGGWLPIHAAAYNGHLDVVRHLLDYGSPLDDTNNNVEKAPLSCAAGECHINIVEFLLNNGVEVNTRDRFGWTPLHYAAQRNNQTLTGTLLDHGATIDATTTDGQTPFHIAIENGCLEIAEYLTRHGANITAERPGKWTSLHLAALFDHQKLIPFLLRHGANIFAQISERNATPLYVAVSKRNYAATRALCEHGDTLQFSMTTDWGLTPLQYAAMNGLAGFVDLLMEHGADPTFGGLVSTTPLYLAAKWGEEEIVRNLVHSQADFNALCGSNYSPFHAAAFGGRISILEILAKEQKLASLGPDCEGRSALHLAARGGRVSMFELLLEAGCDPRLRDSRNRTVLHYAAASSSIDMVESVLQLSCISSILGEVTGWSVLHWAAIAGSCKLVQLLISAGLSETCITADFPRKQTLWTPWNIAQFFNNQNLLSDADCPLTLRDGSLDIVPGIPSDIYNCDSCESVSQFFLTTEVQTVAN